MGVYTIEDVGANSKTISFINVGPCHSAMGMIGLPPTGGFFGKWYIILGALEANNYVAVGAVLLSTMLTLAYFVRIFERVFRHASNALQILRPD